MTLEEVKAAGKNPQTSFGLTHRLLEYLDDLNIDTIQIQHDIEAIIKQAKAEILAELITRIESVAKLKL